MCSGRANFRPHAPWEADAGVQKEPNEEEDVVMKALNQLLFLLIASFIADAESARAQDIAHGAKVFEDCAPCHATNDDSGAGPGLGGIVGRRSGSVAGFRYSRAMKSANIIWDEKSLDLYIAAPQDAVPGNVMPFSGISDARERSDLIAYLETLK
jgi:cytochrome c